MFYWSLLNCVPYVRTCERANVLCALKSSCPNVPCVHECSRATVPCVLTCSCANMSCALTCSRANVSCMLTCLHANVPCVLTCSRVLRAQLIITSDNKNKLSMTCFTQIFGTFCLSFSCEIKLHMKRARQVGISLETFILRIQYYIPYQPKVFNGWHDKLCTIKKFDFCLSRT